MAKRGASSSQEFTTKSPARAFEDFAESELSRLRNSDSELDELRYQKAVELVLRKLKRRRAP